MQGRPPTTANKQTQKQRSEVRRPRKLLKNPEKCVGAKAEITASVPAGVHWRASPKGMPTWGPNQIWPGSGLVIITIIGRGEGDPNTLLHPSFIGTGPPSKRHCTSYSQHAACYCRHPPHSLIGTGAPSKRHCTSCAAVPHQDASC